MKFISYSLILTLIISVFASSCQKDAGPTPDSNLKTASDSVNQPGQSINSVSTTTNTDSAARISIAERYAWRHWHKPKPPVKPTAPDTTTKTGTAPTTGTGTKTGTTTPTTGTGTKTGTTTPTTGTGTKTGTTPPTTDTGTKGTTTPTTGTGTTKPTTGTGTKTGTTPPTTGTGTTKPTTGTGTKTGTTPPTTGTGTKTGTTTPTTGTGTKTGTTPPTTGTGTKTGTTTPTTGTGTKTGTTTPTTGTGTKTGTTTPTTGTGTKTGTTTPTTGTGTTTGTTTGTKTGTTPATGTTTGTKTGTTPTTGTTTGTTGTKKPTNPTTPTTPTKTASAYTYSAPILLQNQNNVTISGDSINGGSKPCISLINCTNIHITNCKLQNGTTVNSTGVNTLNCTGITVDNCLITKVSTGVYAQASQQINVNNNQFLNMMGPFPRGAYVQFNNVSGTGNQIVNNKGENVSGQSNPEDGINLYQSNGTAASPILVTGNMLRGGGPSTTGSGITVGDQGGSYETITGNTVVNTGNIGMQVAGGTHITMSNNMIYSTATSISHLGLGYGNYSGVASNNITITGNKIKWMCGKASDLAYYPKGTTSVEKDMSAESTIALPTGWTANITDAAISATILPASLITMR
jgi:parallel beta helix pectate lyase-like protein